MKTLISTLLVMVFLSSCLTQKPVVQQETKVTRDVKKIKPAWKYETGAAYKIPILTILGGSFVGGWALGPVVFSGIEEKEDEKYAQELVGSLVFGVGTYLIMDAIIDEKKIKKKKETPQPVPAKEINKWVKKYNKEQRTDYVLLDRVGSEITVVRSRTMSSLEQYKNLCIESTQKLQQMDIPWQELSEYRQLLSNDYAEFYPNEVRQLKNAISNEEGIAAYNELIVLQNKELEKPKTYQTLKSIDRFSSNHQQIWKHLNYNQQSTIKGNFNSKVSQILSALSDEYKTKLSNSNFGFDQIGALNEYRSNFLNKFSQYKDDISVKSFYEYFEAYKSHLITSYYEQVARKILSTNKVQELTKISDLYLSNTNESTKVATLKRLIKTRKAKIEARIRAEKERKRRIAEAKREKFSDNKKQITQLRNSAEEYYNTEIPTFEELHYILQEYLDLINENTETYSVKEANQFIRLVERKKYWRQKSDNISTVENFEDRNGFQIIASAVTIKKKYSEVTFRVPNAPKEMITLYQLELVTDYRNAWRTEKNPFETPKSYSSFVDSGRTIYSMIVLKDGTMVVSAEYNSDAGRSIIAERIDDKTIKVSSFSNKTDINLNQGDVISFNASGSIRVGWLTTTPAGIKGWRSYNVEPNFKHGILMGKIEEDGKWFEIGTSRTITANKSGRLYLRMNERDVSNNEGYFTVSYSIK